MLELIAIFFLCRVNAQNAAARGRSRGGAIALTLALWLGFEVAAMFVMFALLDTISPLMLLLPACFGALGGLISMNLARQGPPAAQLPGGGFTPQEMADIQTSPPLQHTCLVTLTHEGGSLGRHTFALNGQPIGALSGGQSLTVGTMLAHNYIVATDTFGIRVKYPLAFTAPDGGTVNAVFRSGRFWPERTTTA